MKKTMIILCAAMLCACGGGHKEKNFSREENVEYLCALAHYSPDDFEYLSDGRIDTIADEFRKLNMKMSPYTSMEAIMEELDNLANLCSDACYKGSNDEVFVCEDLLLNRIEFHLHNSITWYEYLPTDVFSFSPLQVTASPDGKYKFYTTRDINCRGTVGEWQSFCQFWVDGRLEVKRWQEEYEPADNMGNVRRVWQYNYHDTTFYIIKSRYRETSNDIGYRMEIVTFELDGTPKYHTRFFPKRKEYAGKYADYKESAYVVCWTEVGFNVDYTFDPQTLTVTARTQEGDSLVTKTWRLKLD